VRVPSKRFVWARAGVLALCAALPLAAAEPLYQTADRKIHHIEAGLFRPGSVVSFSPEEINAWVRWKVPQVVPQGMREENVELFNGSASAYALVDFLKMRQAKGDATNWLMARLIEGERPLKFWVRVESGGGRCTVHLTRVELSDVALSQSVLDFLIRTFLLPLYPDVKINEPFELGYNIDRIGITPRAVTVTLRR
jgi:hypothetical protein